MVKNKDNSLSVDLLCSVRNITGSSSDRKKMIMREKLETSGMKREKQKK